jgi:hypothetical protein
MTALNDAVLDATHPGSDALKGRFISFSTIPFENTPLESRSRDHVLAFDPGNRSIANAFDNSDSTNKIEFYSSLKSAFSPAVFDTLMGPIAADWRSKSGNAAGRQQFWTSRRTKPLLESIPAAQEITDRMITGWFALAFTGGRKYEEDLNLGPKVSIYSRFKKGWVSFPHPLLGLPEPYADHDMLPAVLTSLAIALVQVNEQRNITSLAAYQTLIQAGSIDPNVGMKKIVQEYIDGKGPTPDTLEPDARREKLINGLASSLKFFEGIFEDTEALRDPFTAPKIHEIKHPLLIAFANLIQAANDKGSVDFDADAVRG